MTRGGQSAGSIDRAPERPGSAAATAGRRHLRRVLETVADFDRSGGAHLELVAWELCLRTDDIAEAWASAMEQGLVVLAGYDKPSGDRMWRLSPLGFSELDRAGSP